MVVVVTPRDGVKGRQVVEAVMAKIGTVVTIKTTGVRATFSVKGQIGRVIHVIALITSKMAKITVRRLVTTPSSMITTVTRLNPIPPNLLMIRFFNTDLSRPGRYWWSLCTRK